MVKNISILKFLIELSIDSISQTCINAYTLILKIFESVKEKKYLLYKNYMF